MDTVQTPFTDKQVELLNRFQNLSTIHPFTCRKSSCRAALRATSEGWVCDNCDDGVQQKWAYKFMADEEIILQREEVEKKLYGEKDTDKK